MSATTLPPLRSTSNSEATPAPKQNIQFVDVSSGSKPVSSNPKPLKDTIHPNELRDEPPKKIWMSNGKVRQYIPKESVAILKKWLYDHIYQPYPSEEEKLSLAAQTNLTEEQVKMI